MLDTLAYLGWVPIGGVILCDAKLRRHFPAILVICGLVASAAGLAEFITQAPFSVITGLGRIINDKTGAMAVINAASSDTGSLRIKGLFAHPIIYGQMMAVFCPVALHWVMFGRGLGRLGGALLLAGSAFGIYACQSRSPLITIGVCLTLYLALNLLDLRSRGKIALFALLAVSLIISAVVLQGSLASVIYGSDRREEHSTQARLEQTLRAQSAIINRPLLGFGSDHAVQFAGIEGRNHVITLDSVYLRELVDGGYLRLTAFVAMLLTLTMAGVGLTVAERDPVRRSFNAAMTSWIPGIGVGVIIITSDDLLSFAYIAGGFLVSGRGLRAMASLRSAARAETGGAGTVPNHATRRGFRISLAQMPPGSPPAVP